MHDFSFSFGSVPIFSGSVFIHRTQSTTNLGEFFYGGIGRTTAAAMQHPNSDCQTRRVSPLSLLRNFVHSSMIVFKYRTDRRPTDRPNTHSHSLVRIETELLS